MLAVCVLLNSLVAWVAFSWHGSSATAQPQTEATGIELPWGSVPIEPECVVAPTGAVEAPNDWDSACRFRGPRGGEILVGHSIRGPREPLMERIPELEIGNRVSVDSVAYSVELVERYPLADLPDELWHEGSLALITCDVSREKGNITHNWVVVLQPAS